MTKIIKNGDSMYTKIENIYQNIYNQELNYKNTIDSKHTSRLTFILMLITANCIILTTFLTNYKSIVWDFERVIVLALCSIITILNLDGCICFYKCFFRIKMNYMVIPTTDIRMFHFYIHKEKGMDLSEVEALYEYIIDSYQYCSYINSNINGKREKMLICLDNITCISFVLSIITYIILKHVGYTMEWIF